MRFIEDLKVLSKGSFFKGLYIALLNGNFHAVLNYRIAHALYRIRLTPLCKLIMEWNRMVHSVDIDYRADLAGGFVLIHGIGVVIGKDVKTMGKVTVYQNVTLGGNSGKERMHEMYGKMTQPILEADAVIYSGGCCLGPVVIGRGSCVGSLTVCTKDVPAGCTYYNKVEHTLRENNI